MDFMELMQGLINPGEDGPSPTIHDDLTAAYQEQATLASGGAEKIAQLNAEIEALTAELSAVKAHNYDLLQSGAVEPGAEPGEEPEVIEPEAESDEPTGPTIDSLFESDDDDDTEKKDD